MNKPDISIIILTYNEELHIKRCLENLAPIAQQIFIVDSYSTDNTITIAKSLGVNVVQRAWKNYSDQFQWGLDNLPIQTDWIMRMDADEYLEAELITEITNRLPLLAKNIHGINLKRKHFFLGQWIKYGDRYPLILLRIWRKNTAHIENRWMDEHIILDSGLAVLFTGNLVDDNLNTIEWFIDKHNRYASREMLDILDQKYQLFATDSNQNTSQNSQAKLKRLIKKHLYNKLPVFVRPSLYFVYRYFIKFGFLDGSKGFAYHFMQAYWYRCLVDLKCIEAEKLLEKAPTKTEKISLLGKLTNLKLH